MVGNIFAICCWLLNDSTDWAPVLIAHSFIIDDDDGGFEVISVGNIIVLNSCMVLLFVFECVVNVGDGAIIVTGVDDDGGDTL